MNSKIVRMPDQYNYNRSYERRENIKFMKTMIAMILAIGIVAAIAGWVAESQTYDLTKGQELLK